MEASARIVATPSRHRRSTNHLQNAAEHLTSKKTPTFSGAFNAAEFIPGPIFVRPE
jgi:hypothetical protein